MTPSADPADRRSVLVPAVSHHRVADALAGLDHDLDVLLWTPEGVTSIDGDPAPDVHPEAAWLSIDLLYRGTFAAMADTILGLGSVRWVQGCLAGYDAPPFQKILGAGIRLSNSDAPNIGVAEYVLGSMLAVVHGVPQRIDDHRARRWNQSGWQEIGGMRWLIVGYGSIGREIARRARPFGVEITGLRRSPDPGGDLDADRLVSADQLHVELARADAVILACPLTAETKGLANADFFEAMSDGAILCNVSRGPVINDHDLIAALDQGTPGTAILDVFDTEPLPEDSPLWSHPRIYLTSHVAGAGTGIGPRGDKLFLEQLDAYLADRPLRLEVQG